MLTSVNRVTGKPLRKYKIQWNQIEPEAAANQSDVFSVNRLSDRENTGDIDAIYDPCGQVRMLKQNLIKVLLACHSTNANFLISKILLESDNK